MTMLTTREAVKAALDITTAARSDTEVDAAIAAASDAVESEMRRRFRPVYATRTFDWPHNAGTAVAASGYLLRPDSGPPFTRLELSTAGTPGAFTSGPSRQRSVSITGLWGHSDINRRAGTLVDAVNSTTTALVVSNGAAVGVGDLLQLDSERMTVVDRTWADTTQDVAGSGLASNVADRSLTVADGSGFTAGELLVVDSETMRVEAVTGNVLTVRRATDGSVLAAHTAGAGVYANRGVTVERGAAGSTAAAHGSLTSIWAHQPPPAIVSYVKALAIAQYQADRAGRAAQSGAETNTRDSTGSGLAFLAGQARVGYQRRGRFR
jgi:hypothetical protein